MLKKFHYSIPPARLTFEGQLNRCTRQIARLLRLARYRILKISFFTDASNAAEFLRQKELIIRKLDDEGISAFPCSVIAQAPVNSRIAAEVCYVDSVQFAGLKIEYKSFREFKYCVLGIKDVKEIISCGITYYDSSLSMYDQIYNAFSLIEKILHIEGMDLSKIIRQWNYIEEIVDKKIYNGKAVQHYQILNDVRELFYRKYRFVNGYPSATGIGMKTGGAVLEFLASSLEEGVTSITNLEQIDAHKYSPMVLVGEAFDKLGDKATPKFERAKLVATKENKKIYISGTAAIKGEQTLGIGDVVKQTFVIVDNIDKLLSVENLEKQGVFIENAMMEYAFLRIYLKEKTKADAIEGIIEAHYQGVPTLMVVADICRSDLLIEVEGMCHVRQ